MGPARVASYSLDLLSLPETVAGCHRFEDVLVLEVGWGLQESQERMLADAHSISASVQQEEYHQFY